MKELERETSVRCYATQGFTATRATHVNRPGFPGDGLVELRPICISSCTPRPRSASIFAFTSEGPITRSVSNTSRRLLGAEPANVQGIADLGTVGAECLFGSAVFIFAAAQRDRLGGQLAYPVHAQVPIMGVVLHRLTDYLSFASHRGRDCGSGANRIVGAIRPGGATPRTAATGQG